MAKNETTKPRGCLNKSEMASSLGISPQAFDKWGVEPVARMGREAFYLVQDVVENRVQHALRKQQPGHLDGEGVDPLIEYKLNVERLRLTAAQADAKEKENLVTDKQLVPAPFATFALVKLAAQVGSILDTVSKTLRRKHPDMDSRHLESLERELAMARNAAAELGEHLPEYLDEYLESLAE
ncbi:terminase small subunit [Pseudomonas sp. zfem005]|uniref:terminase small subunit n=1 Tax=Pseudomonas sp. zfem005 TaxID=3078200 RepID=UPI002928E4EF|nr:terminase small subunit [Pseudomonas sp. zfem005]MDU9416123.1 terminase small subunit [Pseudomonas sp. zfem005]